MTKLGWLTISLIVLLILALVAPIWIVDRLSAGGFWASSRSEGLSFHPMTFQNLYFQGVAQGIGGLVPLVVGFGLVNVWWTQKTRHDQAERARHHMKAFFESVQQLATREEKLAGTLLDKEPTRRQILELLRHAIGDPRYQVAAVDVADERTTGSQLSGCWHKVVLAVDVLTSNELIHGALGSDADVCSEFKAIRTACNEALHTLKKVRP